MGRSVWNHHVTVVGHHFVFHPLSLFRKQVCLRFAKLTFHRAAFGLSFVNLLLFAAAVLSGGWFSFKRILQLLWCYDHANNGRTHSLSAQCVSYCSHLDHRYYNFAECLKRQSLSDWVIEVECQLSQVHRFLLHHQWDFDIQQSVLWLVDGLMG